MGFFDNSHSNMCKVVSYWNLTCISLIISDVEHVFISVGNLYIFFGKMPYSDPLPIFYLDCVFHLFYKFPFQHLTDFDVTYFFTSQ